MKQKRIMILGGNAAQAEAIRTAKMLGYYTISTDLHEDNPGHKISDEYCKVDVADREAVLHEAMRLGIDGVIPYCSDVLASVAAYVADRMGLPGNPCEAVEIMTHKDKFREFLKNNGFRTPRAKGCADIADAEKFFLQLGCAAMMKPVDASGSKGVFKVESTEDIQAHWNECAGYSIAGSVIIEEYIETVGLQQDGDIFVVDGKIVFWGLCDQHKDECVAPYVPAMLSYPSSVDAKVEAKARKQVQKVLAALDYRMGPCNVEYVVDKSGDIYILEIGPRNGGNMIPYIIKESVGFDMVEATVRQAVGDEVELKPVAKHNCALTVVVHSRNDGVLDNVWLSDDAGARLCRRYTFADKGDKVHALRNGRDAIADMLFAFDKEEEMHEFISAIEEKVKVVLR